MARISSRPWIAPSSPGRPCSRLSATSGFAVLSASATSRSTSMRVTRKPCRSSASAQAVPERSDTSRSADQPPMRTATCWVMCSPRAWTVPSLACGGGPGRGQVRTCMRKLRPLSHSPPQAGERAGMSKGQRLRSPRHPNALDLPLELDAARLVHAPAHLFAQRLDIGGAGVAAVDEEIAVHLRDLRITDDEPATAGGVDELPGLPAGRVLEGRAAG